MPLLFRTLMLAALIILPQAAPRAQQASFSPQQRQEIVEIIRNALKTDPSILRDAVAQLQKDEARVEAEAGQTALAGMQPALLHTPGDPVAGNPDGDVTLVEFYDLRCPYCRRMLPVMAELLKADRRIRVVFKDIPILGPGSVLGARAVLAAQRQGGYLRLHDALMNGPATIDQDVIKIAALHVGLDYDRLQRDMADPAIQARIDSNLAMARSLQIDGTPAYVVGSQIAPGAVALGDLQGMVRVARGG